MPAPFSRWSDALAKATDPQSRAALFQEVLRWRVGNLGDAAGQRHAAFAQSQLLFALGNRDGAEQSARELLTLCGTAPVATRAEIDAAEAWLGVVTGRGQPQKTVASTAARRDGPAARPPRPERPERVWGKADPRESREPRAARGNEPDRLAVAADLGRAGDYRQAFNALKGVGTPQATLVRTWLDLRRALQETGEDRERRLHSLLGRLDKLMPAPAAAASRAAEPAPSADRAPQPEPTTRVGAVLGRDPSRQRARALAALHRHADGSPADADALAAAAILDHAHADEGARPPLWLLSIVARALASDGPHTRAALDAHGASLALPDAAFVSLVEIWADLAGHGARLDDLRRGISRELPEDRPVFTLRASRGGGGAFVAALAPAQEPAPEGFGAAVAQRLVQLSDAAILLAPGDGNAAVREAAAAVGVRVVPDVAQAVAAVAAGLGPAEPAASEGPQPQADAPAAPQDQAPRGPTEREREAAAVQAVRECLVADPLPTADDLEPLVAPIKRLRGVFDLAEQLDGADAEPRLIALFRALDRVVGDDVRLLQATTIAVRLAAKAGGYGPAFDLLTSGSAAARLGGPGIEAVVEIASALEAAGVGFDRVLRGVTRREQRDTQALAVLAPAVDDLWRLLVTVNGVRGEVWVANDLSAEGRGAVPLLAVDPRPRLAVLPVEASVLSGWSELGGPEAIGWTGAEASEIATVVAGWGSASA